MALAVGVLLGVVLSRPKQVVTAGNGEINVEMSSAFVDIARKVEPAVVYIGTVTQPNRTPRNEREMFGERPSFEPYRERAKRGNGSGVIVDALGYILTNQHVVAGADRIIVKCFDGTEMPGFVVGTDAETDLAVVKVEPKRALDAARLGDSEKMRVGDWVLAIGSPFGLDQTVTAGIISARGREAFDLTRSSGFQYFLQTDAAINRGNSGGPLINLAGEVIGINTAIATTTGDYNGVGFALPASEAAHVYRELIRQGRVVRGFLGVMTDPVTPQIARIYGLPAVRGAVVNNVNETVNVNGQIVPSPAAKAGLQLNDVILDYRGEQVRDDKDFVRRIGSTPVGTVAPLRIIRAGRELMVNVTVGRRPGSEANYPIVNPLVKSEAEKTRALGISIGTVNLKAALERGIRPMPGVVVDAVQPGSVADDAKLKVGDVIEAINREPVKMNEDFKRVLNALKPGDAIVLQVYRESFDPNPRLFISLNNP